MKRLGKFKQMRSITNSSYVLSFEGGNLLQSYRSIIVIKLFGENGGTFLGNHWDYSRTTGGHRNPFLGEGIAETRKKIENGTYIVIDDLN